MVSQRKFLFLAALIAAAWQDIRTRSLGSRFLYGAGAVGIAGCLLEGVLMKDVLISCGVGLLLLVVSHVTGGGIGEGDGWFFVISGMYLNWMENVWLFVFGVVLCFFWSLPLAVQSILRNGAGRKRELPFLPFLVPAGIWLTISSAI